MNLFVSDEHCLSSYLLRPNYETYLRNNDDAFRGLAKTSFHGAMSSFHSLVTLGFSLVRDYLSSISNAFSSDLKGYKILSQKTFANNFVENSLSVKSTPGFWWIMQMILHPS